MKNNSNEEIHIFKLGDITIRLDTLNEIKNKKQKMKVNGDIEFQIDSGNDTSYEDIHLKITLTNLSTDNEFIINVDYNEYHTILGFLARSCKPVYMG